MAISREKNTSSFAEKISLVDILFEFILFFFGKPQLNFTYKLNKSSLVPGEYAFRYLLKATPKPDPEIKDDMKVNYDEVAAEVKQEAEPNDRIALQNVQSPRRTSRLERPYNVSGWPEGHSLMAKDYVNYYASTADLLPDLSKDISVFHPSK